MMSSNVECPTENLKLAFQPDKTLLLKSPLHPYNLNTCFPASNILSKLKANLSEHRIALLKHILSVDVGVETKKLECFATFQKELGVSVLPALGLLIDNHQKLDYKKALKKNVDYYKDIVKSKEALPQEVPFGFITEVINKIIPQELIGNQRKAISKLGRDIVKGCPPLTVGRLYDYLLPSQFGGCLLKISREECRIHIAIKIIYWFAAEFIPSAIKAVFYGTSNNSLKAAPLFYIKPAWHSLHAKALKVMLGNGYLIKAKHEDFVNPSEKVGLLRFLPKTSGGLRPIAILRSDDEMNEKFKKARLLLKEINSKIINLEVEWPKILQLAKSTESRIIFVRCDVRNAFVTVRHKKILEILDKKMENLPEKITVTETKVLPWRIQKSKLNNSAPVVSQVHISKTPTYKLIKKEIINQKVKISKQVYNVLVGLTQGAPLSNHLCNMVFDNLIQEKLAEFNNGVTSFLWRVVDDFVLITIDPEVAIKFKQVISYGFPDYGWYMNSAKSVDNIDDDTITSFSFNGSVIDFKQLQIYADFSSYNENNVLYAMNIRSQLPDIEQFTRYITNSNSLKLKKIYIDSSYMDTESILKHLNAMGKLQALRFRALILYLLPKIAKEDNKCDIIINRWFKASRMISNKYSRLINNDEVKSVNIVKWFLNQYLLKKSCGYLAKKMRSILKNDTFKLEQEIDEALLSKMYSIINSSQRFCDPKF